MLTYESLIEQAKVRGMPHTKIRGILREYLQILILKELYKSEAGRRFYFTGGTYLRLIHNLKRFSEDLDFNTHRMGKETFENLLTNIKNELKRSGVKAKIEFSHWQNMFVCKIIFPDVEKIYNVVSKNSKKQGIMIKIETNNPKWKIKSETEALSGFGEFYPCVCTDKSALFADKIDALIKKQRARHLYDIMFMLANKYPIDKKILKGFGVKEGPFKVIRDKVNSFSKAELIKQAESLRPFLFDESEADLIINAHDIISSLCKY
jgi:predicted nucleotidyltransferase component of viral defense system